MKKLFKFLTITSIIGAIVGAVYYLFKKGTETDDFDEDFDEDEEDSSEKSSGNSSKGKRNYVPLNNNYTSDTDAEPGSSADEVDEAYEDLSDPE